MPSGPQDNGAEPTFSTALQLARALLKELNKTQVNETLDTLHTIAAALEDCVLSNRSAINAHTRINRLPEEVLDRIFIFTQNPLGYQVFSSTVRANPTEALRVSRVCRHWRQVALSNPVLWSNIDDESLTAAGMTRFLERSKSADLYFNLEKSLVRDLDHMKQVLRSNAARIRELHIRIAGTRGSGVGPTSVGTLLDFPAPNLDYFTLHSGIDDPTLTLFQGDVPKLRKLCLRDAVKFPANRFSNLTHLCVSIKASVFHTLAVLSQAPLLQELILDVFPATIEPSPPDAVPATVCLPHLISVSLNYLQSSYDTALFLSHITFGDHTALNINGALFVAGPQATTPQFAEIAAVQSATVLIAVLAVRGIIPLFISASSGSAAPALRAEVHKRPGMKSSDLWQVCVRDFPRAQLRELWLHCTDDNPHGVALDPRTARAVLQELPALRKLVVPWHPLVALSLNSVLATTSVREDRACPELETLQLLIASPLGPEGSDALVKFAREVGVGRNIVRIVIESKSAEVHEEASALFDGAESGVQFEYRHVEDWSWPPLPPVCSTYPRYACPSWTANFFSTGTLKTVPGTKVV